MSATELNEMNRKATLQAAVERRPYTLLVGPFWKTFNYQSTPAEGPRPRG